MCVMLVLRVKKWISCFPESFIRWLILMLGGGGGRGDTGEPINDVNAETQVKPDRIHGFEHQTLASHRTCKSKKEAMPHFAYISRGEKEYRHPNHQLPC
jgi:hypothetical protein